MLGMTAHAVTRRARIADQDGSRAVYAHVMVGLVVALTFGAIASLMLHIIWLLPVAVGWFVLAGVARFVRNNTAVCRVAMAGALAWAATMSGLVLVNLPGPGGVPRHGHPAFGDHPVMVLAGAPWPGVEGSGNGWAHERIPFFMGIDALLVNFTVFAVLFAYLLRGSRLYAKSGRSSVLEMVPVAAIVAGVATLFALMRLIVLFD